MGSDFTFQIDVTTAASLARCLLTPLMNSPTFITQGHWSEGSLPCAPDFSKSAWNHETPQTTTSHLGVLMPLLGLLNSFQTLSKQKTSVRLEWLTATEGFCTLEACPLSSPCLLQPCGSPTLCQEPPSEDCEPAWPALGPGIWYGHQFYISPISINI